MPIDPWIARGGVPLEVDNTLARIGALKQRDQMLQQDAAQNAFMQQRYADAQAAMAGQQAQGEQDDAEWDAAYAAKDWATMAKLDPQATKAIFEFEQAQQPKEPLQQPTLAQQGGYSYLFDPTKGVIPGSVQAPQRVQPREPRQPSEWEQYQAMGPEQRKLYDQWKGRDPVAPASSLTTDGNGVVYDLSKATDGERTAVGYYDRMVAASQKLESEGLTDYVPSMPSFMAFASLLDDDTGVIGATVANKVLNDADREYMGQALDMILAKMRKESGATIKGGEFRKEYINMFPMPNDPPKVLEDKRAKRQLALSQLRKASGRAAGPVAKETPAAPGKNPEVQAALNPKPGQRGKSKSGKPIIYRNGQWEYE